MFFITDLKEINDYKNYILYFYADWIIEHKKMSFILNKVNSKYKLPILAVNTDILKYFAKSLDIQSIPCCIFYKDKKNIKKIEGLPLTQSFMKICNDIYSIEGEVK